MSKYNAQFKLSVVQQYLTGSAGYELIAKQHGLNPSAIKRWVGLFRIHGTAGLEKKFTHSGGLDALSPRTRGKPQKMPTHPDNKPESLPDPAERSHEELVAEVNQLRMEVAYLKKLRALVQAKLQQRTTTRKKRK